MVLFRPLLALASVVVAAATTTSSTTTTTVAATTTTTVGTTTTVTVTTVTGGTTTTTVASGTTTTTVASGTTTTAAAGGTTTTASGGQATTTTASGNQGTTTTIAAVSGKYTVGVKADVTMQFNTTVSTCKAIAAQCNIIAGGALSSVVKANNAAQGGTQTKMCATATADAPAGETCITTGAAANNDCAAKSAITDSKTMSHDAAKLAFKCSARLLEERGRSLSTANHLVKSEFVIKSNGKFGTSTLNSVATAGIDLTSLKAEIKKVRTAVTTGNAAGLSLPLSSAGASQDTQMMTDALAGATLADVAASVPQAAFDTAAGSATVAAFTPVAAQPGTTTGGTTGAATSGAAQQTIMGALALVSFGALLF